MPDLLVIDDEVIIHEFLRRTFKDSAFNVRSAQTAAAGVASFLKQLPDVVLLDVSLPDQNGLETFRQLRAIDPGIPVIFITGGGTTATAIEATAMGAYEYMLKPFNVSILQTLVCQAWKASQAMRTPPVIAEGDVDTHTAHALVGRCPAMHAVFKAIGRVAQQETTVLITGESGTGKELVAHAIHQFSLRSAKIFLPINCAAIPEPLLESELFGHEKGAFTGADQKRIGKFEKSCGGTLLLDEIGDMSPLMQAKILRVLQDQQFERVGGNETIQTNVRVLAATNRDLEKLVAAGKFRHDLFYRLNAYPIKIPPLRERLDDLPLLIKHFLGRFAAEMGKAVRGLSFEAQNDLRCYSWPGNVRELQSVIQFALLQSTGPLILSEFLPPIIFEKPSHGSAAVSPSGEVGQFVKETRASGRAYEAWMNWKETELLMHILQETQWNISAAAKFLGIARATLRSRLAALGITRAKEPIPHS